MDETQSTIQLTVEPGSVIRLGRIREVYGSFNHGHGGHVDGEESWDGRR